LTDHVPCESEGHSGNSQSFQHNFVIVQQKHLTQSPFRYTVTI
jgi:hypothetical protein